MPLNQPGGGKGVKVMAIQIAIAHLSNVAHCLCLNSIGKHSIDLNGSGRMSSKISASKSQDLIMSGINASTGIYV